MHDDDDDDDNAFAHNDHDISTNNNHHHFDKFKHNDRGPLWGRFLRNFGRLERL
jgi:hypothetical protein